MPFIIPLLISLFAAGCVPRYAVIPARIVSLAVLPVENQDLDLDGPPLVRGLVTRALVQKRYGVENTDAVDEILRTRFGVTDGGQLRSVRPKEVAKALNVDALIFVSLQEFSMQTTGFLNRRTVALKIGLYDGSTGEMIWQAAGRGVQGDATLSKDEALKGLLEHLAVKWAEKIAGSHLAPEAEAAVRNTLQTFPPYGQ